MKAFLLEKRFGGVPNGVLIAVVVSVGIYLLYHFNNHQDEEDSEKRFLVDGKVISVDQKDGKEVYLYRFFHKGKHYDGTIAVTPEDSDVKIEDFLVDNDNGIKIGVIEKKGRMVGYLAVTPEE